VTPEMKLPVSLPAVSVVLPTYNNESTVGRALASILLQDGCDFEVIAVDSSTDRTPEILAAFAARDSRVRVVRTPADGGEGLARTFGIQQAAGEFVAAQDGDDISLPGRLRQQCAELHVRRDIHWLATWGYTMTPAGELVDEVKTSCQPGQIRARLINGQMSVIGASMMARRESVLNCGGYRSVPTPDFDLVRRFVESYAVAALPARLYAYVPALAVNQPRRYRAVFHWLLDQYRAQHRAEMGVRFWLHLAWTGLQGFVPGAYPLTRWGRRLVGRARPAPLVPGYQDWLVRLGDFEHHILAATA
jgi:glycosyltransferase involved in cell wall biosynthesis